MTAVMLTEQNVFWQSECYRKIKDLVISSTGLSYFHDRNETLQAKIQKRMTHLGVTNPNDYFQTLIVPGEHNTELGNELGNLIQEITIGETYFFRHPEHFNALQNTVFPDVFKRNLGTRKIRIWSAACSNGAELYSLAIVLREMFNEELNNWDITLLGTDINANFLSMAQEGVYGEWVLRETPDEDKARYFTRRGKDWVIKPAYKNGVNFRVHNLLGDPPPCGTEVEIAYDIILCRNVLIYFSPDTAEAVLARMGDALNPGGWLMLGPADFCMNGITHLDPVQFPGALLYQKRLKKRDGGPMPFPMAGTPLPARSIQQENTRQQSSPPIGSLENEWPLGMPVVPGENQGTVQEQGFSVSEDPCDVHPIRRLLDQGNWEEAKGLCQELVKTERLNSRFHFYQALVMEHEQRWSDAEGSLRRAVYLDGHFILAHFTLGNVYMKLKKAEKAKRALENVLELLKGQDESQAISEGDGLLVCQLKDATHVHLQRLRQMV